MKSKYLTIGGLSALSVTIIANFGFADVSSDRLDTYKANKLIPSEVQIATINSVSSESAGVAVFSPDVLSWKSYSNAASAALGKYMDWTREDFEAFFADSANEAEFEDAWEFLSQTGNDHLQGATISDADSLILLQSQLDSLISSGNLSGKAFPCEGLDFTGRNLQYLDLSNCTGLTGEQLMSSLSMSYSTIPSVDFTGVDFTGFVLDSITGFHLATGLTGEQLAKANHLICLELPALDFTDVDLSNCSFTSVDFSRCTGLTGQQILSSPSIYNAILPKIDFSGADFSGLDLLGVDFSHCTGLTWGQLSKAANMSSIKLPSMDLTNADMSGMNLQNINFSNCSGLTWEQLSKSTCISDITLPSMDLTNADMSNLDISGINFTKCTGLTGEQISKASNISYIQVTSEQYSTIKSYLPRGKYIYVDGVFTRI